MAYRSQYPEIMTARKVDNLTLTRRAEEERIKNLVQYQKESTRLINAIKNFETNVTPHSSASGKRTKNPLREDQNDHDDEKERVKQLEFRRIQQAKKDEEEIQKEKERLEQLQKERLEREIQRICESSEELRELERNIKIGYVNKERAAQHQESLLMKEIDHARDALIEQCMEEERQKLIDVENGKDRSRRERLVAQKVQLQEQMYENEVGDV